MGNQGDRAESSTEAKSLRRRTWCNLPQTADRQQFERENRKDLFSPRSSSSGWQECVENGWRGQDKPNSYFKEITARTHTHTHTHTVLGYHDHKHHQHLCARTVSCWTSWKREEFSKHKLDSGLALHILWSSSKSYKLRTLCVWFVYWLHTTPVFSFQVLSAERHLRCYLASF